MDTVDFDEDESQQTQMHSAESTDARVMYSLTEHTVFGLSL